MKQKLRLITMGLLMAFVSPVNATLVNGTFNGAITGGAISEINGSFIYRPVGTPVTAVFSYDSDYLAPADGVGNRQDSFFDPSFYFLLVVGGSPFASYANGTSPGADAMSQFTVDATGRPVIGHGSGGWNIFIGPDIINLYQPPRDGLAAKIEGIFSVPDSTATIWLLGMTCTGLMAARRFLR